MDGMGKQTTTLTLSFGASLKPKLRNSQDSTLLRTPPPSNGSKPYKRYASTNHGKPTLVSLGTKRFFFLQFCSAELARDLGSVVVRSISAQKWRSYKYIVWVWSSNNFHAPSICFIIPHSKYCQGTETINIRTKHEETKALFSTKPYGDTLKPQPSIQHIHLSEGIHQTGSKQCSRDLSRQT